MRNNARGATYVELAIVAPILFALLAWFWDIMVELIALQRMHGMATVWAVEYYEATLRLENDVDDTGTAQLTPFLAADANDFLDRVIFGIEHLLVNSGTGAAQSEIAVAGELHYYNIHNSEDAAPGDVPGGYTVTEGYAIGSFRRGAALRNTSATVCWGKTAAERTAELAKFTNYIAAQSAKIIYPNTATTPPFGTVAREEFWDGSTSSTTALKEYVPYKAVTYIAVCVNPPRFYTDAPIVEYYPMLSPKEARF